MNSVKSFGAKGDGITKDTAAIQSAIDAGGVVCFPAGIYLTGTLYLKSNGGLFLETGAVLKASPDKTDYNQDDFCPQNRKFSFEYVSGAHLITAVGQHDIILDGGGHIDGNRQAFYGTCEEPKCERIDKKFDHNELKRIWRPAQMIFLCNCRNVRIKNLQLDNAPYWTCFLHGCEDAIISGLRILNDQRTHNGDGIDIDCCRRVTISDCIIDSGDDCITLRGNWEPLSEMKACESIAITNCILHTNCNALRIGVGDGIVRNAVISNIVFHDCRTAIAVISNYSNDPARGVQIENVSFENLQIDADQPFIVLSRVCDSTPEKPTAKEIRSIRFRNIHGTFNDTTLVCGCAGTGINEISFDDIDLICTGSKRSFTTDPTGPFGEWMEKRPDAAFYVTHANNVSFNNVSIQWQCDSPGWNYGILAINSPRLKVENSFSEKALLVNGKTIIIN